MTDSPPTTAQKLLAELTGIPVDYWPTNWAGDALRRDAIALEHQLRVMAAGAGVTVEAVVPVLRTLLLDETTAQLHAIGTLVRAEHSAEVAA